MIAKSVAPKSFPDVLVAQSWCLRLQAILSTHPLSFALPRRLGVSWSSGTKRGTHRMWRRGGRSAPSETADRTTCGRKQRPHMGVCVVPPPELEPGTQGLPSACPGAALMCLFCLVQQQFWRPPGSAEDRPITVESWSLPMNKR